MICRSQPMSRLITNRANLTVYFNPSYTSPNLHSRYYYYNSLASSLWYVNRNKNNIHLQ